MHAKCVCVRVCARWAAGLFSMHQLSHVSDRIHVTCDTGGTGSRLKKTDWTDRQETEKRRRSLVSAFLVGDGVCRCRLVAYRAADALGKQVTYGE